MRGTAQTLAFSPDLRHAGSVALAGCRSRRLTRSRSGHFRARPERNGTLVALARVGEIRLLELDDPTLPEAKFLALVTGRERAVPLTFSPDGRTLALEWRGQRCAGRNRDGPAPTALDRPPGRHLRLTFHARWPPARFRQWRRHRVGLGCDAHASRQAAGRTLGGLGSRRPRKSGPGIVGVPGRPPAEPGVFAPTRAAGPFRFKSNRCRHRGARSQAIRQARGSGQGTAGNRRAGAAGDLAGVAKIAVRRSCAAGWSNS